MFDSGVENGVDGDLAVCSDLIDVSKECNLPERVPRVYKCMQRRSLHLDIKRSHTLISLLSQVRHFKGPESIGLLATAWSKEKKLAPGPRMVTHAHFSAESDQTLERVLKV